MTRWPRIARIVLMVSLLAPWLIMLAIVAVRPHVLAAGTITIDGSFGDWSGQPSISDPLNDCHKAELDITSFSFTTNPGAATAYFMVRRQVAKNGPIGYILSVDTNNDGDYTDSSDRNVHVRYDPTSSGSRVDVTLTSGTGQSLGTVASNADWGESLPEGGLRVEWPATFTQLNITSGQPIRMRVSSRPGNSNQSNSICDTTGDVQWSPADALGYPLLGVLLGGALLGVVRERRRRRTCPTGC
jgi:hypothetical protein